MDEAENRVTAKGKAGDKLRRGARMNALNKRLGADTTAYRAPTGVTFGKGKGVTAARTDGRPADVVAPERPEFMTG